MNINPASGTNLNSALHAPLASSVWGACKAEFRKERFSGRRYKKARRSMIYGFIFVAEGEGFEPSMP